MKKRIPGILLTLCMVIGLVSTAVFAEGGTVKTVATEQELVDALNDSANDTVKLTADIKLNDTLSITRTVTLDLNGCMLGKFYKGSQYYTPSVSVESGGTLTLIDSDPTVERRFSSYNSLWTLADHGDHIARGGVITGSIYFIETCVYVKSGGSFIMKSGNIVGGQAEYGGGVRVEGSFTMEGGNIMGCRVEISGGGVYVRNGTFTMTGGKIDDCRAYLDGDGIYLCGSSVMYASGGEVNANIFIESNSRITAGAGLDGITVFKKGGENTGTIRHGSFSGEMTSSGTISGGTFSDKVTNTGVISGGTFAGTGTVANKIGSTISGGTFNGTVTVEVVVDADNGSDNITQEIPRGQTVSKPDDPQKADYYFVGWYNGDTPFYFDEPVYDAVMIKAKWTGGVPVPRLRINAETNEWEVSYDAGYTWTSLGVKANGEKGDAGTDGIDGKDGTDGKDGIDGKNGKDGDKGDKGDAGQDGKDGTGISAVAVDQDGSIIVTLTDGSTYQAGNIPVTNEEVQELRTAIGVVAGVAGVSLVGLISGFAYTLRKRKKLS